MRSGKRSSRLAIAGVAGLAAVSLVAGCGSSGKESGSSTVAPSSSASTKGGGAVADTPQALLLAAASKTEAAKNAKIRIDVSTSADGKSFAIGGDGLIDFTNKKFQLILTLPATAGFSGSIEERVIGNELYMMLPSQLEAATGGKPWVKIDTSQLGTGSSGLGSYGQDPTQFLSTLRSVSDSVTKVGTADIRGVKTTHYRAEVDLVKATKASGAEASALEQYEKVLGTTLPEDVYIDDSGLARRVSVDITPKAGGTAGASIGAVSTTVDFYDFGSTDTSGIVAPPPSEIGTLPTGTGLGG